MLYLNVETSVRVCSRYAHPVFPHDDDVIYVGPWDVGSMPIADWCSYSIECQYEVSGSQGRVLSLGDGNREGSTSCNVRYAGLRLLKRLKCDRYSISLSYWCYCPLPTRH